MSGVYDYPTDPTQTTGTVGTAGGNGGVNVGEGVMTVPSINNAQRGALGDVGAYRNDISAANTSTGTGSAYLLSTTSVLSSLSDGTRITWLAHTDNTGAATLNVDTLGAKKLLHDSAALVAGEITGGHPVDCVYDASADSGAGAWLVLNPVVIASTFSASDINNDSGVSGADVGAALDQLDGDISTNTTAVAGKQDALSLISQADAEAGTATGIEGWSATRVSQAIAALSSGTVLGFSVATSSTYTSTTSAIPTDDTAPQSTEGLELLTLDYTPKSTTSTLLIFANIPVATANAVGSIIAAIFNGGSSAIQTAETIVAAGNYRTSIAAHASYAPGVTSAQTISVRVGRASASTIYIGGLNSGSLFGSSTVSSLLVMEVE